MDGSIDLSGGGLSLDSDNEDIEEIFNVHWGKKNDAKLKLRLSRRLPDDDSPFFYRNYVNNPKINASIIA